MKVMICSNACGLNNVLSDSDNLPCAYQKQIKACEMSTLGCSDYLIQLVSPLQSINVKGRVQLRWRSPAQNHVQCSLLYLDLWHIACEVLAGIYKHLLQILHHFVMLCSGGGRSCS